MPNRLDIELTSARGDGSYTWRAAGARQPKGVIDGKLLSDSAKVGDVLRVEAEVEIDGITILSVLPPKEKATPAGRIELIGSSKPVPAVTTVLVSEGGHGRGDRRDLLDSPRRGDRSGTRDRRPSRGGERPETRRPPSAEAVSEASERRPERRPRAEDLQARGSSSAASSTAASRPARPVGERRPERRPRAEGAPASGSSPTGRAPGGQGRPRTPTTGGPRSGAPAGERARTDSRQPAAVRSAQQTAPRRTAPRFEPGTAHRDVLFASLAPEQRPIAERLAAGGIPAVRRAIAEERERARSEGRPELSGEAILALAEQIASSVKQAIWLDRAEAAVAQLEQLSLRDLRTTVAAAAPRDETARELDRKLREELDRRVKKLRSNWEEQITHALEEGRVLQALRFSAQPPEPTARFPAALVERLASSASAAMTATSPVERWLAVLDAAVASPIRRQIHPEGMPQDPSGEVVRKARLAAGSIPALAPMVGLSMPPPPKPIRTSRPPRPLRPPARASRRVAPPTAPPAASATEPGPALATDETAAAGALPESLHEAVSAALVEEAALPEAALPEAALPEAALPEAAPEAALSEATVDEAAPEPAAEEAEPEATADEAVEAEPEGPLEARQEAPADSSSS